MTGKKKVDTTLSRTYSTYRQLTPYGPLIGDKLAESKGYDHDQFGRHVSIKWKGENREGNKRSQTVKYIRGGDAWQGARDALTFTGPLGHDEQAGNQLNLPHLRSKHLYQPIRAAAIEQGVLRPVNRWKKAMKVHDRMGEIAKQCRRDLMCLQRYKGDYPVPHPVSTRELLTIRR